MNLVLNARDAMPSGGRVTILTENVSPPDPRIPENAAGDFVRFDVLDSGVGIPNELLSRVFEPFFTTKTAGKGTGLGLAQAFGFARQSGGTISIESEVGKGTRVTFCLPRADVARLQEPQREETEPPKRRHARILMVEDNSDVTEATSALIKELGYTVRLAASALEALRILEAEAFDVVFSDIMMPGDIDGLALAKIIRDKLPGISVLLASGSLKLVQEAREQFVTLQKPNSVERIDTAVQQLLAKRDFSLARGNLVDLSKAKVRRRDPSTPKS
jgi:CheY-like chemotaxis protein